MKKFFGVAVLITGIVSGIMLFVAGSNLSKASSHMTELRSIGGTSFAEAHYQDAGKQGVAYSTALYACGIGILAISVGLSGLLLSDDDARKIIKKVEDVTDTLTIGS